MPKRKLLLFLLSTTLFASFIYFSYLVAKNHFIKIDFDTTVRLQDHISRDWDLFFSLFSVLGLVEITGFIWILLGLFLLIKRYFLACLSLILLPLALALEVFGKVFVYHPAPPHLFYRGVLNVAFPSNFVHTDFSYPSGHLTRTSFLVLFLITYFYLRSSYKKQFVIQPTLLGILFIMAISRIYLGEHWTSDVVGGTLIGSSFGILSALFVPAKKD